MPLAAQTDNIMNSKALFFIGLINIWGKLCGTKVDLEQIEGTIQQCPHHCFITTEG